MRTIYKYMGLCALLILSVCLISGCGNKDADVLVVLGGQNALDYDDSEKAAKQWAEEKSISIEIVAPEMSTVWEQQKVLEDSIRKNKWDLIVVEPLGDDELYSVLDYAKSQGSVVVAMQGAEGLEADYTVQPCDYQKLGSSMMDVFAGLVGQSGEYVTIVPAKDSDIVMQEETACVNQQKNTYLQMLPASRLQEGASIQDAYDITESLYGTYGIRGALFFSYSNGLGISQWIQDTGNDIVSVGVGTPDLMNTAIEAGTVDALFYWNRDNLLKVTLEVGYRALEGSVKEGDEVITTSIEGYRTLRSSGSGTYYGDDISSEIYD